MTTCIKTGFYGLVVPYDEFVYGDAYQSRDGTYYFRICSRQRSPIPSESLHFRINDYHDWFDKEETSMSRNSTMICSSKDVEWMF